MTTKPKQQPLQRIKLSPLTATIWAREATTREGEVFTAYSVDIQRTFKKGDGSGYSYSNAMRPRDLGQLALLASMACDYLTAIGVEVTPIEGQRPPVTTDPVPTDETAPLDDNIQH